MTLYMTHINININSYKNKVIDIDSFMCRRHDVTKPNHKTETLYFYFPLNQNASVLAVQLLNLRLRAEWINKHELKITSLAWQKSKEKNPDIC